MFTIMHEDVTADSMQVSCHHAPTGPNNLNLIVYTMICFPFCYPV